MLRVHLHSDFARRTRRVGVVFPRLRIALFVSGCFWHGHTCGRYRIPAANHRYWLAKINLRRDRRVQGALRRLGWRVLVVWECQTVAGRRKWLRKQLRRVLCKTLTPLPPPAKPGEGRTSGRTLPKGSEAI